MRVAITWNLSLAACLFGSAAGADGAHLDLGNAVAMEGDATAAVTLDFVLTRSGDSASEVTLRYQTVDDTAAAPGDYAAIPPSTLTLAPGQLTATVPVTVIGDALEEDTESMFLRITGILAVVGAPPVFAAARDFFAGNGASAATAADLNGDARPDLAVANPGSDTLSVLLNTTANGAGIPAFAPARAFTTGNTPNSVTAADVNGDGRPDLAVANTGGDTVSVRLNTTAPGAATAAFAAAASFAVGSGPGSVTAADVNGDGRPDLAVANASAGSVSVLLNTTAPDATLASFADASEFAAGAGAGSVTAADVDGDGRPDLVVANAAASSVSVLLNTTAPDATLASFADASQFAAGAGAGSVAAADVNGDGRVDLAVTNSGDASVSVLLNTTAPGAGAASYAAASTLGIGGIPVAATATDVDGDGRADLAVTDADGGKVSVLLNTTPPGASAASYAEASVFAAGSGANSVAAADINGDGLVDLAVANSGDLSVLLNQAAVLDTGEGIGTVEDDDSDFTPDPFTLADQADVEPSVQVTSAAVTITGVSTLARMRVSVSGGQYSIGCTSTFTSTSSVTLRNDQAVCVRHVSSALFSTATDTTLTVEGVSDTFTSVTLGRDTQPNPFKFIDVTNALMNSPQVSNSVTISGIRDDAPISVTGGEYSIGCSGTFTAAAGSIAKGRTVCVRHVSSAQHGTATSTTLTVGGVSDTFTSTTPAETDLTQTGALGLYDVLPGLLAALGFRRRRRSNAKTRSHV